MYFLTPFFPKYWVLGTTVGRFAALGLSIQWWAALRAISDI